LLGATNDIQERDDAIHAATPFGIAALVFAAVGAVAVGLWFRDSVRLTRARSTIAGVIVAAVVSVSVAACAIVVGSGASAASSRPDGGLVAVVIVVALFLMIYVAARLVATPWIKGRQNDRSSDDDHAAGAPRFVALFILTALAPLVLIPAHGIIEVSGWLFPLFGPDPLYGPAPWILFVGAIFAALVYLDRSFTSPAIARRMLIATWALAAVSLLASGVR
jgi:hypothetical protein